MNISAAALEKRIDELIAYCDANGEPPAAYVMRRFLGVSEEELNDMREGKLGKKKREAVSRLDDYRTYFWTRKGLDDPRWATFSTFNLKLLMGIGDKGADGKEIRVNVRMDGVGEDAFG